MSTPALTMEVFIDEGAAM
jgi:hypothetical protein